MTELAPLPKGSDTLTIGCKLPNGLICELGVFGSDGYQRVQLNGANSSNIIGGYGITENVSAKFWEAWVKKYGRLEFVRKGLVFAERDLASARDQAKDFDSKKTGMERLDPKDVSKVAPGAEADMDHLRQGLRDGMQRARAM